MSSQTANNTIGGIPYILDFLHVYLPFTAISSVSTLIGIIGNLIVIISVLIDSKLRVNPTCILILNLASADLLISFMVHPSNIAGVFLGKHFFDRNMILCEMLAAICLITCCVSLITMGFLALNRYICIFYTDKYKSFFSVRNTILLCLFSWISGTMIDLPNYFGIGDHVYDLKTLTCHFDRLKKHFTLSLVIFAIILPGVLIGSLHLKILCLTSIGSEARRKKSVLQYHYTLKAIQIAKSLFITFIAFFLCWVPFSIVLLIDTDDKLPIWIHTSANFAAHFHSAMNPILYLCTNPMIRDAYRNLLRRISCDRIFAKRKQSTTTSCYTLSSSSKRYMKVQSI